MVIPYALLRKLQQQLNSGGGGGPSEAFDATELQTQVATPASWTRDAQYLPLGPLSLEASKLYLVSLIAEMKGDTTSPDYLTYAFITVEHFASGDVVTPAGASSGAVAADWVTTMWSGPGVNSSPGPYMAPVVPTDVYAIFAAQNQAGGPATAPVHVRNRRLSAILV